MSDKGYTIMRGSGEWSALYDPEGDLVVFGDHYVVDDKIFSLLGVNVEHDGTWYIGDGGSNYQIAQTLDQIEQWDEERAQAKMKVDQLLGEADKLKDRYRFS